MKTNAEIIAEVQRFFGLRPRSRELKMRAMAMLRACRLLQDAGNKTAATATLQAALITIRAYRDSGDVNVEVE